MEMPNNRSMRNTRRKRAFFCDDGGFTTVGMVLALLISLSLIFSAGKIYRLNSTASGMQNIADAAALAAENQVAEFYIVADVCDAVVLSLSLTAITAFALGAAALCTPVTAAASETLINAGREVMKARDDFARKAADGLERLQEALPFIAAANAASLIDQNSRQQNVDCFGTAILLPTEGLPITVGAGQATQKLAEDIDRKHDEIQQAGSVAEDAAKKADEHKRRAFQADCGNNPGYCMYERAATLSGMSGSANPLYTGIDAWSFSVALKRAKAYYPIRLSIEQPQGSSVEEQSNSALRKVFFRYACDTVEKGYVNEGSDGSFDADFPVLPGNTDEMRATELYTMAVFPISESDGQRIMHAWDGCPYLMEKGTIGAGSISEMEASGYAECPTCRFLASSLGKVAAASTTIENGFEHHYRIVAEEAKRYQEERERFKPESDKVRGLMEGIFGDVKDAIAESVGMRIEVYPPGRCGAVALVAATEGVAIDSIMPSSLVVGSGTLGTRAAISAATLVNDDADESKNLISSLLDGVSQNSGSVGVSLADAVLDIWGGMLSVYTGGQEALIAGVEQTIDAIPFASASGLGTWASDAVSGLFEAAGLQPANLSSPKPVLVNSEHVVRADWSSFSTTVLQMKTTYAQMPGSGTGPPFSAAVDALGAVANDTIDAADEIVIVEISLIDGGPTIPIKVALPPAVKQMGKDIVSQAIASLSQAVGTITGSRVWQ